jgi:hypothetical protein
MPGGCCWGQQQRPNALQLITRLFLAQAAVEAVGLIGEQECPFPPIRPKATSAGNVGCAPMPRASAAALYGGLLAMARPLALRRARLLGFMADLLMMVYVSAASPPSPGSTPWQLAIVSSTGSTGAPCGR